MIIVRLEYLKLITIFLQTIDANNIMRERYFKIPLFRDIDAKFLKSREI